MKQYIDIVNNVLENGQMKGNRTGVRALTTFCEVFRHDMSTGYPLLTTKKMPFRVMAIELEGFIKGITNKAWYKERKCKIWNEWANPEVVNTRADEASEYHGDAELAYDEEYRKALQEGAEDLGPIYGYQWRFFNWPYTNDEPVSEPLEAVSEPYDQFNTVVQRLKENPDDRRMIVSAWNPMQISQMALPPCHYAFTLVHINGVLNLSWKQRSCDLMLGVPFNIASYALLLELLCKESGLIPGELVGILEDCHIYENHLDTAKEQVTRHPNQLPRISIKAKDDFNIFDWTYQDVAIEDYDPLSPMPMPVAV